LDGAHNYSAFLALRQTLKEAPLPIEGLVIGFSKEKDVRNSLQVLLPWHGPVFFTQASTSRAMESKVLKQIAREVGLEGESYPNVQEAIKAALASSKNFLVTGSIFVVAEALRALRAVTE
ncbi:MAG: bifunctional folylpolyglutamate synthase/dihydrofolate synthase, partial [Bacteroidia bacterium]|nr:bifunctional folylpolyglutamate synthase/dihydrofolate synthase [Bacteroidia bacterium]